MVKMFNYNRGADEFNDIIDEVLSFASAQVDEKEVENKADRLKKLNYAICEYCTKDTKAEKLFAEEGLNAMKNPAVVKNRDVQENFDAVIAQIINPIMPMVANRDLIRFVAEVRQIGWGDTARFIIRSNELYKVNEIGIGVNRGVLQPIHDNEVTVDTRKIEIAAEVDFYPVAAGVFDWGDFGVRAARSFEHYTFLKVVNGLLAGATALGAAYTASGFTVANWTALAQKVSAANGGARVYAIGTLTALSKVYPDTVGLQYGLGEKIAADGYLDKFYGTRLIALDQALAYNTVNTTAAFAVPDDKIFFLPVDAYAPVKIVYEGNSTVVERDPDYTPDRTYRIRIQMFEGVETIIGSKYAILDLN